MLGACGIVAASAFGGAAPGETNFGGTPLGGAAGRAAPLAPLAPSASAPATDTPYCYYGACYDYVAGDQSVDSSGLSVVTSVEDPKLDHEFPDEHSLQEISIQDSAQTSTVELGWTVDEGLNGDYRPHLFVYHWVDGQESCYNGCGFVSEPGQFAAGKALNPGTAVLLRIQQKYGAWRLSVDGMEIGYFPDSLWSGSFTAGQLNSVFGEVAMDAADVPSCTQMGDGAFGTRPNASWFADYELYGTDTAPALNVFATSAAYYDQGSVSATGFRLGGPGSGAACPARAAHK
jgi:hypothetical protein